MFGPKHCLISLILLMWLASFCLKIEAGSTERFIALPNAEQYFDGKIKNADQDLNLLVTRFDMPGLGDQPSTSTSSDSSSNSSSNTNTTNSNGGFLNNPVNMLMNSNFVKQLGVGVQVNF